MDTNSLIALLTAIIAGTVALIGYSFAQFANRRERKSKLFAEALAVIYEYQELPFRIRRRAASDGVTRAALGGLTSDVMTKLGFYLAWLHMESPEVGALHAERMLCLSVMRRELYPWGFLYRRANRRLLDRERQVRADEATRLE